MAGRLILVRHAKSDYPWGVDDHDRPLSERGRRDAPASPVQVDRTRPFVKSMFPGLGPRLDATAWKGARPCLPDMLPVIGPAPGHTGLWFDFGHQHLGFTLGPVTGRLIAEMMTGEAPFTDASPYSAARF